MVINNDFNKLQINEVIDKDANGNVLKRSLMLNIRCNDVEEADSLYRQLKAKFNGETTGKNSNTPMCECGRPMILRNGKKGPFYGCSGFPKCRKTRELNELAEMVAMEDAQAEEIQIS